MVYKWDLKKGGWFLGGWFGGNFYSKLTGEQP